jgi:hypothetical protein
MEPPHPTPETAFFWDIAEPLLTDPSTTIGTLMQFPCLRVDGTFFATATPGRSRPQGERSRNGPRSPSATQTPGDPC